MAHRDAIMRAVGDMRSDKIATSIPYVVAEIMAVKRNSAYTLTLAVH
jgi:hypothetical protein